MTFTHDEPQNHSAKALHPDAREAEQIDAGAGDSTHRALGPSGVVRLQQSIGNAATSAHLGVSPLGSGPSVQRKNGTPVNNDPELEAEADVMGAKAMQREDDKGHH